jgi:PAS domain S-box-containing protein
MKLSNSVQRVLEGRLSTRARWALGSGALLLTVATALLNLKFPLLRLPVLAFVYVLAFDLAFGVRSAVVAAVALTAIFGASDWLADPSLRVFVASSFLSRLIVFGLVIALVQLTRRQTRFLDDQKHEAALRRLKDELAENDARFRSASESIPFGIWRCNLEGRVTYMSPSFLNMLGMTLEEIRAGGWFERVADEDAERIREAWRNRNGWGDVWEDEYRIRGADGKLHVVLCRGSAVRNDAGETIGWTGVNFDLTERTKARDQLRLLVDVGRTLTSSLDPSAILQRVARVIVPRYADWFAVDILSDDGNLEPAVVQHSDAEMLDIARELRAYQRGDRSEGAARVLQTGGSELFGVITDAQLQAAAHGADERYLALLRRLNLRSAMMVPLRARDKVLGVMTFAQAESSRTFSSDDLSFAEILSARVALAFDHARMYEREQRVADTFQRASLPTRLPRVPGIKLRAKYVPGATESEIGGDWYDAFLLPSGEVALSIGDVVGKGLPAAVAMVTARQAIRGAAFEGSSPKEVLQRVNVRLTHEGGGMVTALYGIMDPVTLQFTFASAGHPSPLIGKADGSVEAVSVQGPPLGIFPDCSYDQETLKLEGGSTLVLYTDGLIEFNRDVGEGERALAEAVRAEMAEPSGNPSDGILRRMIAGPPKDDVALLTLTVSALPLETLDLVVTSEPSSARVLRQSLRRLALGVGLDDTKTTDLLLASGEAISNVIEHAYGCDVGPLMLRVFREGDDLVVRVADRGRWRTPRDDGSGRGLRLMEALVDKLEIQRDAAGTTVLMRISLSKAGHDGSGELSVAAH